MLTAVTVDAPRVTEGMSFADYLRIDAVNISSLVEMEVSPKRYRHRLTHPKKDTGALRRGRASHTLLLQPHRLEAEYAIMPAEFPDVDGKKMCKASRKVKSCQLWCEEQEARDLTILTLDELAEARAIVEAVRDEPLAMKLLEGAHREVTLEWTDPATGIRCKGRLDAIRRRSWIWDLKTTLNPVLRAFKRQSTELFYHAKMSWYQDAAVICGFGELPVWMTVVGSDDEHDVVVYEVLPSALDAGRLTYSRWLDRLAECRATNRWPGVSGGQPIPLEVEAWAVPPELQD